MKSLEEFLKETRYPGRFMVIGMLGGKAVILYGATGRSPSSLKRRFIELEDGIYMTAIDATVAIEGNPELLEYPAVRFFEKGIAAANGTHIERLDPLQGRDARQQLSYALADEAYEPDEHWTPRITGCIIESSTFDAALHIIRANQNGIDRSSWTLDMKDGTGYYISTYRGDDVKPTPSFPGEPISVAFSYDSVDDAAKALHTLLAPKKDEMDYRVAFIAVFKALGEEPEVSIVNAH